MKMFAATVISLALMVSIQSPQTLTVTRSGSQPARRGPAENFTGSVHIEPLFSAHDASRASGARVTFEPGARTAWHTHPLGQHLVVTAGSGWVQRWGGPVEEIRNGDVVWIPAGVKHWHGATQHTAMTHIAIQEELNGNVVEWMEQVTNEQYRGQTMKQRDASSNGAPNTLRLRLKVADRTITATLIDSETARDFISLLPLTLTMNDLFRREKFGHLPRAISSGGKRTHTYAVGDIVYWAPGPDVAVYYRHDGEEIPNPGIIVVARTDSGVDALDVPESVRVTIEALDRSPQRPSGR